ncbi:anaphase promoting complex (APC) subunit 2 domain-containing protein [Hirsutella rhossiliensis]|uniref:Anaphase-promoting complex subunit 2 n=1 Tax=Hirsutella rhossiliensis TaxID=111463 RepID=A0A9P8N648_9HYPO|nr:anaphase promoting complex (APC) subunit 2 domain-containing protein [Hirsutella rhossiliensis]KAH0967282.1 anaphase promoting complex (APC) subunit 2 domain-containing protein [Hirsutella rhossiliensis]
MTVSRICARKTHVFRSIFPPDASQPTPLLASSAPAEPFGGPSVSLASLAAHHHNAAAALPAVGDQVRWDRAWHAVTSRIQLPTSVAVEDSFAALAPESQDPDAVFHDSLSVVLDPAHAVPHAAHTDDVLLWHARQVRQHFIHHVLPLLAACAAQPDHAQVLLSSVQTLEAAHRQYLYGLTRLVRGIRQDHVRDAAVAQFRRDLHALVGRSWAAGLTSALRAVLRRLLGAALMSSSGGPHASLQSTEGRADGASAAREELFALLESLKSVGLAGDTLHVLSAEVMDLCVRDFIQHTYSGDWAARDAPGCMEHLCSWVDNHYGRLAVQVFGRLGGHVSADDVERWRDVAVGRLATLRTNELFDIVLHWPESRGGLEDLRSAVTTPQRRLQLTDAFSAALQKRLLHPGRSTVDILQTYISMIRTFHALDSSKVLLDRVAHALQLYLCQRDDAVRIVVTGLLANPSVANTDPGKSRLAELAAILNDASQQHQQRNQGDDDDLDWNDLAWVPDPVDAGVNYKRPKSEDVIGTLISALGSQDIFIKEFQLIVAERLLSSQAGFQQEIKVLGLLKKRFGEGALQNCDVMIKDIFDSRRVDAILRRGLRAGSNTPGLSVPTYHAKILSRLFWPSLRKEGFKVPPPVAAVQSQYEAGFEQLKTSRKLGWLNHLGSATVRLDLEDRCVELECKTYEAAVIYAFHDDGSSGQPGPRRRAFNEIWQGLMIDEELLELALGFWVSRRVLRKVGNQTYELLEKLADEDEGAVDDDDGAASSAGDESGQVSPRKAKSMDSKEKERRAVYWQFIVGMLTNSSPAMPLGQISMMMKMLIADGCPWSNEELQEFLGEKVAGKELELAGGKYRLPKK